MADASWEQADLFRKGIKIKLNWGCQGPATTRLTEDLSEGDLVNTPVKMADKVAAPLTAPQVNPKWPSSSVDAHDNSAR